MNSDETELSSLIRRIASASRGAMVICLMFGETRSASVARMLSVTIMFSIGEAATREAPSDSPIEGLQEAGTRQDSKSVNTNSL